MAAESRRTFAVVHATIPRSAPALAAAWREAASRARAAVASEEEHALEIVLEGPAQDADAPLRAVRAALEARRAAADLGYEIHVGIHAGDSRSVAILEGLTQVARFLAGLAPPGGILASKPVERAVPRRFRFTEQSPLLISGEAILPYALLEELPGPTEWKSGAEAGPLEGRAAELGRLLEGSLGSGARCVWVEGAEGLGKARLLLEARERVRAERPGCWVARGRCELRPPRRLAPFAQMLRDEGAASGTDRWDGERVMDAAKRLMGEEADAGVARRLALSIGESVEGGGQVAGTDAQSAWLRWLQAAGGPAGALLCIEDAHEADEETLALLESLATLPADRGVAVLVTSLPGRPAPAGFARLPLDPLGPDEAARVAARACGGTPPAETAAVLREAGGNPLLIEELCALAREAGAPAAKKAAARGPEGVAAARIALLGAESREALAAGAVLGRAFWKFAVERLLARDASEALAEARKRGLVFVQGASLMRGEGQYLFRHASTRRAAEGLPGVARLHAAAAKMHEQTAKFGGEALRALAAWHGGQAETGTTNSKRTTSK